MKSLLAFTPDRYLHISNRPFPRLQNSKRIVPLDDQGSAAEGVDLNHRKPWPKYKPTVTTSKYLLISMNRACHYQWLETVYNI